MKTRLKLIILCLAMLVLTPVQADQWESFGIEFKTFLKDLDQISKAVEREYAIDQLSQMHRDLYLIERSHLYLIIMIENPGMIDINLNRSRSQIRKEVNLARSRLRLIGKKVSRVKSQTSSLQKLLYQAAYSKQIWPSKIRKQDIPDYHQEHYLLTEGKAAFQSIQLSREALEAFLKTH